MKDIREILTLSEDYLAKHKVESPKVNAEWIISDSLKLKRLDLYLQYDRPLNENELSDIRQKLQRCAQHEPVQYICGSTNFYGLEIFVGPGVLIPRPETEYLIDHALKLIDEGQQLLDICTGSGCIPIAIQEQKNQTLKITASDLEENALAYAKRNIEHNKSNNIDLIQCDLFSGISQGIQFDLITSNPPYVSHNEIAEMGQDVLKHEPKSALFAEEDGMAIINEIAASAPDYMNTEAYIIMEIGAQQGKKCLSLFESFNYRNIELLQDYSSRDRIIRAQRPQ
ncbi:peptide chain release factor N(5)-glutamine methyltransferase [Lentisphaera profundi]|uniref:Release factor glutamine methyltransferase n=1 Tax=Lentisphaera profundi TaxID=1658616 RepID=A0ABY7VST7_9BACT|nr:peptide chain release factor N(5)-glutamine methyltransferase [Lentisphaera profundi]WDE96787.1 peptide chain release factor N(5)-glutamine methyltransferase [Lentisphaera profundi]